MWPDHDTEQYRLISAGSSHAPSDHSHRQEEEEKQFFFFFHRQLHVKVIPAPYIYLPIALYRVHVTRSL